MNLSLKASSTLPDGIPWSGYQFSYIYDATGNPVEQNKNGLVYSNSFNNLNQNVDTVPSGTLTVLGEVNYPAGTATVNTVQAQIAPDGTFAAPGIPIALGTNTLASVFTAPFGRTTNTETTVTVSPKTYGYDLNGNLTNDSRFVYSWDYENRLTALHDASTGALVQENRYDALWRRREKIEYAPDGTAATNRYIYKDWLVLAITDASGTLLETYTHGADLAGRIGGVAGGVGGILAASIDATNAFFHYDYNGNVVQSTAADASLLSSLDYTPFGLLLLHTGPLLPRFQFSSKEYDLQSEMFYYGYRFYSPSLSRAPNRDPLSFPEFPLLHFRNAYYASLLARESSLNGYSFSGNAPLDHFDALGLFAQCTKTGHKVSYSLSFPFDTFVAFNLSYSKSIETEKCPVCCADNTLGSIETITMSNEGAFAGSHKITFPATLGLVPIKIGFGYSMSGETVTQNNSCTGLSSTKGCNKLSFTLSGEGCAGPKLARVCLEVDVGIKGSICENGKEQWKPEFAFLVKFCNFGLCYVKDLETLF